MWGIAFTGHPPTDEQPLPCPSEVRRDLDMINRWPGNQPAKRPVTRPTIPPTNADIPLHSASAQFTSAQLGRPNIPVLKRDLEVLIRDIVKDILREERA